VAFLLTTRGIPQITWGDELGQPGHMDDRRDFPGGFPGDPRDAFSVSGRNPAEQELFATYRALLHLRKSSLALRRGTLTELVARGAASPSRRQPGTGRLAAAWTLGGVPARVPLPPEVSGAADRLLGEAGGIAPPARPRLELPRESAAVFRLAR